MKHNEKQTQAQRRKFDVDVWIRRFNDARAVRGSSGWEEQAREGYMILSNDLPLIRSAGALKNWKGQFYVDNWLYKSLKWLISLQSESYITVDVKSFDGMMTPAMDITEQELNFAISNFKFDDVMDDVQWDRYFVGYGVNRTIWDTEQRRPNYITGIPIPEYISPFSVCWDPATKARDKSDIRWIFHEEEVDYEDLLITFPELANNPDITPQTGSNDPTKEQIMRVVTVQYRVKTRGVKRFIQDRDTGTSRGFDAEEWDEYIQEVKSDPEQLSAAQQQYMHEQPEISFDEWLQKGGSLPEKVYVTDPLSTTEFSIYQAIFIPELRLVVQEPQYVGKRYGYHILVGCHIPDSPYPIGLAAYMKDAQETSIILMTVATISAIRYQKNEKLIQEDSLVNQEEYLERGYEIGVNPIVKREWQMANPGVDAVKFVDPPQFPQVLTMLNDMVVNSQKTMSGAIDSNMGLAQYSGQSGIQVAQLQMAGRVYQKHDLTTFRRYVTSNAEWLKENICRFRNYPHQIMGITSENEKGIVEVAVNSITIMIDEDTYVEITIQDSQEVVKQVEKELATMLFDRGLSSDVDYLRALDRPNPEKAIENANRYKGIKELVDILTANPDIMQMFTEFIHQAGITSDTTGGEPSPVSSPSIGEQAKGYFNVGSPIPK